MTIDILLVNLAGTALIGWIVWYFWLSRSAGVPADVRGGVQSALVVVKGGYTPDTIVVEQGRPVRLVFRREEYPFACQMGMLRGRIVVD
jgi:plastocyanin domain-containing protein